MTRRRTLALVLSAILALLAAVAQAADPPPGLTREQVEQIVREYLMQNPEVVTNALRAAEVRRREAARRAAQQAIGRHRDELLRDATSPVGGNTTGDVTVVEFFDYACVHCKKAAAPVRQLLREDSHVRLVYKEFPVLGEGSVSAARAALAANAQGKYAAFHDALMASTAPLSEAVIHRVAGEVGLDVERLEADMASAPVNEALERNQALAHALGVTGTPTFVVGDELVVGAVPLARLKDMVARARQTTQTDRR